MISLEYIAGLFDGEGMVAIVKQRNNYNITVRIYNSHKPTLEQIAKEQNGILREHTGKKKAYWKRIWTVEYNGENCKAFLVKLMPYLKIKQEEAEIGLQFIERLTNGGGKLTTEELAGRKKLYAKCRELKARKFE